MEAEISLKARMLRELASFPFRVVMNNREIQKLKAGWIASDHDRLMRKPFLEWISECSCEVMVIASQIGNSWIVVFPTEPLMIKFKLEWL